MRVTPLSALLLVLAGVLVLGTAVADDKKEDPAAAAELLKLFQGADAVFTAKVGKVNPLGHTNSIPATVFGEVSFTDAKAVRGELPAAKALTYSHKEGVTQHLELDAEGAVLVAVKGKGLVAVVPATAANLALAKKPVEKK